MTPDPWAKAPTLLGTTLALVPLSAAHDRGILEASDDDEVFRWLPFRRPTTLPEASQVREFYLRRPASWAWAQIDRATDRLMGVTGYYAMSPRSRSLATGATWFSRSVWRTRLNSESKLLLLDHAFGALSCVRVQWDIDTMNHTSRESIERIGGVHEAVKRKQRLRPDGTWRDTWVYSMLDDEWPRARQRLVSRHDEARA